MAFTDRKHSRRLALTAGLAAALGGGFAAGKIFRTNVEGTPAQAAPTDDSSSDTAASADPGTEVQLIKTSDGTHEEISLGPDFPQNERGETYGSAMNAPTRSESPDLVAVELDDGSVGFVRADDFYSTTGAEITTPEEAVAWEKSKAAQKKDMAADGRTYTPVEAYATDGVSIIGTWTGLNEG